MICLWCVYLILDIMLCLLDFCLLQSQTTRSDATSHPSRNLKRKKPVYAETSSDDDTPLASSPAKPRKSNGKTKVKQETSDTDNECASGDAPIKRRASNGRASKPPKKKVKEETNSSNEDKPLRATKRVVGRNDKLESDSAEEAPSLPPKKAAPRKRVKEEDGPDTEIPKQKKGRKTKKDESGSQSPTKAKGKKKDQQEEQQEDVFRWWENNPDADGDGSVKWITLEHNGVIFPPPYESLPSDVKMKYNGNILSSWIVNDIHTSRPQDHWSTYLQRLRKLLASTRHY